MPTQGKVADDLENLCLGEDPNIPLRESSISINPKAKIFIKQLNSDSSLKVLCQVEELSLSAVVDTAADVTIISDRVFARLKSPPTRRSVVNLHAAGENLSFKASQVGPLNITLGEHTFSRLLYVAPIKDDMLLGIDLLKAVKAKVDLGQQTLEFSDQILPLNCKQVRKEPKRLPTSNPVTVSLTDNLHIPPESEVMFPASVEKTLSPTMLFIPEQNLPILGASAVYDDTMHPQISLINSQAHSINLKQGTKLGVLVPISSHDIMEESPAGPSVRRVQTTKAPNLSELKLPDKLQGLWDKVGDEITPSEKNQLKSLLIDFQDVFADSDFDLGHFNAVHHHIDTGDAAPVKLGLRRTPVHFVKDEDAMLDNMLKGKIIQPSHSSWAAAPVLVRKKDGGVRWCIDYRGLNQRTKPDVFPLPLMSECLDALDRNVWFSKLDANSAYWQIPVHPDSKEKTAFRTRRGLFEFNKLPFGLSNSPSTFCRAMSLVLRGLDWKIVLTFLDDICVLGRSTQEHLANLREVFMRFRAYGLKLKPPKCDLFKKEVVFLGRKVGRQGMTLTDHSISVIKEWKVPTSIKEVERFLGLANFHRSFIKDFAKTAEPLCRLLKKKDFVWTEEQQQAFDLLKGKLSSPSVLTIPRSEGKFILDTDASDTAIGAELHQIQDGEERVVAFASYALTPLQRRYCTTRKELLAVVRFTNHFKHYLLGREFTVRTDHHSLVWLMNFRNIEGQLARWLEELSRFSMKIEHRPGKHHGNADALSRRPHEETAGCSNYRPGVEVTSLPCGGCNHCTKIQSTWGQFEDEVDNVVDLSTKVPPKICKVSGPKERICQVSNQNSDRDTQWQGLNLQQIRDAQSNDPELSFLLQWLLNKTVPDKGELMLSGPIHKHYWVDRKSFYLFSGVIFKEGLEDTDLLVVLSSTE